MRASVAAVCIALGACQTAEQAAEERERRMPNYIGMTMAQFMAETGLTPNSHYPVAGGRVFVVDAQNGALTFPGAYGAPTIHRTFSCRLLLTTRAQDQSGTAETWRIVEVARHGACG